MSEIFRSNRFAFNLNFFLSVNSLQRLLSRGRKGLYSVLPALSCLLVLTVQANATSAPNIESDIPTLPSAITAGADHSIKRWDAMGKLESNIGSHDDQVVALFRTDKNLLSGSADGTVKTWNALTGKLGVACKAQTDGAKLTCLSASADGELVVSGASDGSLSLFDSQLHLVARVMKAHGGAIHSLVLSSDASKLISASADQMIRTWQVKRKDGRVIGLEFRSNIAAHDQGVDAISLSSDDQMIASISEDGSLKTWKLKDGGQILRVKLGGPGACVAFSPDGKILATGDKEGKIKLWNAENGASIAFSGAHDQAVNCLAWSADGKTLMSGSEDKTLRYWDIASSRERAKIAAHDGAVLALLAP